MRPRKITLFLADGLPKGIQEVTIDQWSGRGLCAPRHRIDALLSTPELAEGAAVYFLIGGAEAGGLPKVYVGEADGLKNRIRQHDQAKDWWEWAIVFVERGLTKTRVQYLESMAISQLRQQGRCVLDNGNHPQLPTIPKEDISGTEMFFENITLIIPLFGYDLFAYGGEGAQTKSRHLKFTCKGKDASAIGVLLPDGKMKVLKGSTANLQISKAFETHNYRRIREQLIQLGKLKQDGGVLKLTDDYIFDSPSAAAAVLLGRSASGPLEWLSEGGKRLKDLQDTGTFG